MERSTKEIEEIECRLEDFRVMKPWLRTGFAFLAALRNEHMTKDQAYAKADEYVGQLEKDLGE